MNQVNRSDQTVLHVLCENSVLARTEAQAKAQHDQLKLGLTAVLGTNPRKEQLMNQPDAEGFTALHYAIGAVRNG